MDNTNLLVGMACPKCKSEGPFRIAVMALAVVHDDGTEIESGLEWNDDSNCYCMGESCDHYGTVKDFSPYQGHSS